MDLGTVSVHKSFVGKPYRQENVWEITISTEQQCLLDFSKDLDWLYLNDLFQVNKLHSTEWDAENKYRGAGKSLARPTSRWILFDGQNISFDASLVIYINSTNIPPIVTINRVYEHQNLLSL